MTEPLKGTFVLNEIAIDNTRDEGFSRVMIEWTDPVSGLDYLMDLDMVKTIRQQNRPTLFPERKIIDVSLDEEQGSELDKERIKKLLLDNSELAKKTMELKAEISDLKTKLQQRVKRTIIAAVEAWTYDREGNMVDHHKLDVDSPDEDVAIGDVVITLTREEIEV